MAAPTNPSGRLAYGVELNLHGDRCADRSFAQRRTQPGADGVALAHAKVCSKGRQA
jgi:hypothetical protein